MVAKITCVFIMATIVIASALDQGFADMSESRVTKRESRPPDFLKRLRNWLQHMLARTEELIQSGVSDELVSGRRRAYTTLTEKIEDGVSNLIGTFEELSAYIGTPSDY